MVRDHGATNKELAAIARRKSLMVPAEVDGEHRSLIKELSTKAGSDFDRAYATLMAGAHAKAVTLFTQATQGQDADLAAFARKTLPALRVHKQMAESLEQVVGPSSGQKSTDRRE
jgi:putative membrane protein